MKKSLKKLFKEYWGIVTAGIVVLGFFFKYSGQESLWPDEALYGYLAMRVHDDPLAFFSPEVGRASFALIPIAVYALKPIDVFLWIKLVNLLFLFSGFLLAYFIVKEIAGESYYANLAPLVVLGAQLTYFFVVRALTDIPGFLTPLIAVFFTLKYLKESPPRWVYLLLAAAVPAMMKLYGVSAAIIPGVAVLYEGIQKKNIKALVKVGAVLAAGIFIGFFLYNLLVYHRFLFAGPKKVLGTAVATKGSGYLDQVRNLLHVFSKNYIYYGLFFFLTVYYVISAIKSRGEGWGKEVLLGISVYNIVFLAIMSFLVGEKAPRYLLPLVATTSVMLPAFLQELKKKGRKILSAAGAAFVLLSIFPTLSMADELIKFKSQTYTGFFEVGRVLCGYLQTYGQGKNYQVFAVSERAMKAMLYYYGCKNYAEMVEGVPKELEVLKSHKGFLEIDVWEYTAPKWVKNFNQNTLKELKAVGYMPVYAVTKTFMGQNITAAVLFFRSQ